MSLRYIDATNSFPCAVDRLYDVTRGCQIGSSYMYDEFSDVGSSQEEPITR